MISATENAENDVVVEAWNTILFEKFSRFEHLLTKGLSAHSDEAFRRAAFARGARVLDIGCGFGDTTRRIADMVGPEGRAVGVDCAENFVARSRQDAEKAQVENASFFVADVQAEDLRGPYDSAFSRFGTMFFNLPGAALRNVRKSLRPGGELLMIVWRRREDQPWMYRAECLVKEIVPVVSHEETDQVHCGPGPFSMAGPDMVSDMLQGAGYEQVRFERYDTEICIGRDMDEAISLAMALGPAGEILRLAGDEAVKHEATVVKGLRDAMSDFVRDDGIWAGSSAWFVRARNPDA